MRQAVRFLKRSGAFFIKVYDGVPRDSYFAVADEAKKQNIPFAGHVRAGVTSFEASDAGQRSIEHLGNILRSCSTLESEVIGERAAAVVYDGRYLSKEAREKALADIETVINKTCLRDRHRTRRILILAVDNPALPLIPFHT